MLSLEHARVRFPLERDQARQTPIPVPLVHDARLAKRHRAAAGHHVAPLDVDGPLGLDQSPGREIRRPGRAHALGRAQSRMEAAPRTARALALPIAHLQHEHLPLMDRTRADLTHGRAFAQHARDDDIPSDPERKDQHQAAHGRAPHPPPSTRIPTGIILPMRPSAPPSVEKSRDRC